MLLTNAYYSGYYSRDLKSYTPINEIYDQMKIKNTEVNTKYDKTEARIITEAFSKHMSVLDEWKNNLNKEK